MATLLRILEPGVESALHRAGLVTFNDFLECRLGESVHASSATETRRIRLPGDDGQDCFLKVYLYAGRPPIGRLAACKPMREARNYELLRACGLDVPDVLAVGARRSRGVTAVGFLLTRAIPRACPLADYWEQSRRAGKGRAERRNIIRRTAEMVSRMHAAHLYHIDLQWRNLLVSPNGADDPRVFVLDCVRGGRRIHPLRRAHGRLRDLSSIFKEAPGRLSRAEQVRWLRYYLGASKLTEVHRAMIRAILMDRAIKDGDGAQPPRL